MATIDEVQPIVDRLVGFGHALRAYGLPVGSDDVVAFCRAAAELSIRDPIDVFWAGRTSLVHRREHLPIYDQAFREYFHGVPARNHDDPAPERPVPQGMTGTLDVPDAETGDDPGEEQPLVLGLQASPVHVTRNKRFQDCTDEELAAVRRIINKIKLEPPLRRTRRSAPDARGNQIDMRRMARAAMRLSDDRGDLLYLSRKQRARPLILLLDISGSMADHSRNLLQFAYSMHRAARRVEVFCFGTSLTRITPSMDRRDPDDALRRAADRVVDWDGGTRIGDSLDSFVRTWGRRGLARSATVVICSDGLDRGSPSTLADALERLSRLCHRIVWMNPLAADDGTVPATLAMAVAEPFIDVIETGHDLAALEDFATRLTKIR